MFDFMILYDIDYESDGIKGENNWWLGQSNYCFYEYYYKWWQQLMMMLK